MDDLVMDWFDLSQGSGELETVLDFMERVPDNLKFLFNRPSFRDLLDEDAEYGISSDLFFSALSEAKAQLDVELEVFKDNLYDENFRSSANLILVQIGFTNDSLKLKANVLKRLWADVTNVDPYGGIISFASSPIVKLTRKFLTYLNSLLGSLTKLVPGVDGIKEIKEIGESYLAIADA